MKSKFLLPLLALTLTAAAHAATILPDSCGNDKIKFDVTTQKGEAAPTPIADGKARIIFVETVISPRSIVGHADFTTRFGIDGTWAGAASSNSYFSVDIAPGEHHLCTSASAFFGYTNIIGKQNLIRLTSFTAEPGKTYYFEFNVQLTSSGKTEQGTTSFTKLEEDDGKFRIKAEKLAVPTVQKPE